MAGACLRGKIELFDDAHGLVPINPDIAVRVEAPRAAKPAWRKYCCRFALAFQIIANIKNVLLTQVWKGGMRMTKIISLLMSEG